MALDRFVQFPPRKYPKKAEVEQVIKNFLGGVGTVEWKKDRFFISLPGTPTYTYKDIKGAPQREEIQPERWIEVCIGNPMDIITRMADEFTNALAARLAKAFARYWEGTVDDGT